MPAKLWIWTATLLRRTPIMTVPSRVRLVLAAAGAGIVAGRLARRRRSFDLRGKTALLTGGSDVSPSIVTTLNEVAAQRLNQVD